MAELETTVSADSEIEREVQEEEGKASWPYATLVFFGFFGTATPEGRRLARWTAMATVGAAIGGAGLASGWPGGPGRLVWAVGMVALAEVVRGAALAFFARRHE